MFKIDSLNNQTVKDIVRLGKAGIRKEKGLIIIDGAREISLAVKSGLKIEKLFYCPILVKKKNENAAKFFGVAAEKIIEVSQPVFQKICYKENPDGFLAVAIESAETVLADFKPSKKSLIIILENVEKPGNLGAILRTAYAVGAAAIIINDNQTDIYNPNVIRASEGYVFAAKIIKASVEETVKWLKKNKIKSFGAASRGSKNYFKVDLSGATAIVLGSEADGLSAQWLKSADSLIKIPMSAGMDSLNVSVAAAVILFEAVRQRGI
jgi:TrmH family RNA methyltransferase